tara:strand:- start:3164 stop:3973 length:810 start_codon:yes stop_codon:yes gene_type:complete
MVEAYGYKQQIINELKNIDNDTNNFYNYKSLNFLSKLKTENENIVINFHGSIPNKNMGNFDVVFRGYNYNIKNTDIICISDYLLSKYKSNYTVNWSLSTKKHANLDLLYKKLFEYIINRKKYKNVIFTGTSAGGFPSLKFGSFFKSTVIISNSQLYIENYVDNRGLKSIKGYIDNDDEVIYENKMIEKIILQSPPKKVLYYQNTNDIGPPHNAYSDFLQFKSFTEKNKMDKICIFISFYDSDYEKHPHFIQFPDNKKHHDILQEFLKTN